MSQELWISLAKKYLTDHEMSYIYRQETRVMRSLIKKKIIEDIQDKLTLYHEKGPPLLANYDCDFIKINRKATVIETEDIKNAKLITTESGFDIYIGRKDEKGNARKLNQKRTSLAHELGHTYLYNMDISPPQPLVKTTFFNHIRRGAYFGAEEGLPYEIGRELLVPTFLLEKNIPRRPSLGYFFKAHKTFLVTKQLMAKRLFWSPYDYEKNENFWKDAILLLYPFSKLRNQGYPMAQGNREVYKGAFFKNFDLRKNWEKFQRLMDTNQKYFNNILFCDLAIRFKQKQLAAEVFFSKNDLSSNVFLYLLVYTKEEQ